MTGVEVVPAHDGEAPGATTQAHELSHGDFFTYAGRSGQVVSVHRPRTDWPHAGPVREWEVEYVEEPGPDAPVLRVRIPAETMVEAWS